MIPTPLAGALLALAAALVWGSGDFSGGVATGRSSAYQVLLLAALAGLTTLAGLAWLVGEPLLSGPALWLSAAAGVSGAMGLAFLYYGLSVGSTALVAPVAAVVGAVVPVIFEAVTQAPPGPGPMSGFVLALAGIWLVTRAPEERVGRRWWDLSIALLAGLGFGGFFILIEQPGETAIFQPLLVARCGMLGVALLLVTARREPVPRPWSQPLALLAGFLDASANVLFLLATRYTRLDIAVVLSSLYPAATVLLAALLLRERVARGQWVGVLLCLAAVVLIVA